MVINRMKANMKRRIEWDEIVHTNAASEEMFKNGKSSGVRE